TTELGTTSATCSASPASSVVAATVRRVGSDYDGQVLGNAVTGEVESCPNHMYDYPTNQAQPPAVNESPFVAQSNSCGLTVNRVRFVLLAGAAFFATSLVAAQ